MPARPSSSRVSGPSRPTGAYTSTRRSVSAGAVVIVAFQERTGRPDILRDSGHDALKVGERLADADPFGADREFADRRLVAAGPLLHNRNRLAHHAAGLEKPQHDDAVGQIADVDR